MRISIITINRNHSAGLRKTLQSVASQEGEVEHIIIDGGSTDDSVDVINDYRVSVNGRYEVKWVSEMDNGIYCAMNKGIRMASGDYIQFLNSGDYLVDSNVISRVIENLQGDICIGNVEYGTGVVFNAKQRVSMYTFIHSTLPHTSAFIKRSLFDEYGLYDENLRIVSDWKWYLQVVGLAGRKVHFMDITISHFEGGGISNVQYSRTQQEREQVLANILPESVLNDYVYYKEDLTLHDVLMTKKYLYRIYNKIGKILYKLC